MIHRITPNIRTPEDLGIAHLGDSQTSIVPPKCPIDRADFGRKLAALEGGKFTPFGYIKGTRRKHNVA